MDLVFMLLFLQNIAGALIAFVLSDFAQINIVKLFTSALISYVAVIFGDLAADVFRVDHLLHYLLAHLFRLYSLLTIQNKMQSNQ